MPFLTSHLQIFKQKVYLLTKFNQSYARWLLDMSGRNIIQSVGIAGVTVWKTWYTLYQNLTLSIKIY